MASVAPWHLLKSKQKESVEATEITAKTSWVCPASIQVERHARFYRDLLKSTEKVELTLSHSGKKEKTSTEENPGEPVVNRNGSRDGSEVILVALRTENDPRLEFLSSDGTVGTRPEYRDERNLTQILITRSQALTPYGSKSATPLSSPKQTPVEPRRPPPPSAPSGARPPPPPRVPPGIPPEKRSRQF
jgi:hypothetical protein